MLLAILEVDFMSIINDSSDDEIDPSSYQYISLIPHAAYLIMWRQLSQIAMRRIGEVIDDEGLIKFEDQQEFKEKKEV